MPPATTGPAVLVRVAVVAGQSGYQTQHSMATGAEPRPGGLPGPA